MVNSQKINNIKDFGIFQVTRALRCHYIDSIRSASQKHIGVDVYLAVIGPCVVLLPTGDSTHWSDVSVRIYMLITLTDSPNQV